MAYEWSELVHPDDREVYTTCMTKLAIGKLAHYDLFYRVRIADGRYVPCHTVGGTIHSEDGLPYFIGGIVESEGITDRICPLTGLGNKLAFELNRKQSGVAEHFITVVDFERINSEQGYSFGSAYLLKLAERLTELVGDDKCLYRLHGATFAILSDRIDDKAFGKIFQSIREELQGTFVVDGVAYSAEISEEH